MQDCPCVRDVWSRVARLAQDCHPEGFAVQGANATYGVRAVLCASKCLAAVQAGIDRASAVIAVSIEFLLGQDISTGL
jgi:hypothetical protein